jgi:carbon storage regulator
MLVLTRRVGDSVVIDGRIRVVVLRLERDSLKLGIDAPSEVAVHRQEVYEEIQRSNEAALVRERCTMPSLKGTPFASSQP